MLKFSESKEFEKRSYSDVYGNRLPYRFLKPKKRLHDSRYPLVLYLHGAGEKGSDNEKQVTNGVEQFATRENREKYPCFVVVPQCPENEWWTYQSEEMAGPLRLSFEILASLQHEFSIDAARIYITGISMGAFGTWDAIEKRPDYFAAAVPVCGGGDPLYAGRLVGMPIWAFHGEKDSIVDVRNSREMIEAIRAAGGHPRYTEYPGVGHASWNLVYRDEEMYAWLFSQARQDAGSRESLRR